MALDGPLLLGVAAGLILSAVIAWRTELRGRGRLAVMLICAGSLGILLALADDAGFGTHVILVVDESEVPRLAESGLLRESLAGASRIEVVAITPTGRARTAARCLRSIAELPGALGEEGAVLQALVVPKCNRPWYQTIIAVVPSSRMGAAIAQTGDAETLEAALKDRLIREGVPLTLLHDEGRRYDVRWLVTRPYSPATPRSGPGSGGSATNYRVAAYAYALRARRDRATGGTTVMSLEDSTGRSFVRTDLPVMPWDSNTDVIGPVPLIDEANLSERLGEGVTMFRETRSDDSGWFAVTADTLSVELTAGDDAWNDEIRLRWAPFIERPYPVTTLELVERAATTFDAARAAQNRFAPFHVVSAGAPADATIVLPNAMAPPLDRARFGFDEGGRVLTISRSCGRRERHGTVYLSFDHSRLSQQKAADTATAGERQMWIYDALIRRLQAGSDRQLILQATRPGSAKAARGDWESADCTNRGRMSRPMLGRKGNDWMYQLSIAAPFFVSSCSPTSNLIPLVAPTPPSSGLAPKLTAKQQVRREYVSSHLGLRAGLLLQQEPDLSGDTSLVGITVVFLVLDVGQLKAGEIGMFSGFARNDWNASGSGAVTALPFDADLEVALKRYIERGAAVYVVPIAVPPALDEAWSKENILQELLEQKRPSELKALLEGLGVKAVTAPVRSKSQAEDVAKIIADHVALLHAPRDVGGEIVRDPRYQTQARIYDDVCATGTLLEASTIGRGVESVARFNPFSPINWLYDESGRGDRKAEAWGAFSTQRGLVGLGAQIIADTLVESARPYGNRRALGARSVQIDESGGLVVVAPSQLAVRTIDIVGGKTNERSGTWIANRALKQYRIDADQWIAGTRLVLSGLAEPDRLIELRRPASLTAQKRAFRWLPTSIATSGFVMSGGAITDYHRSDLWANVVLVVMGVLTVVTFSPWVTPWALLSWFGGWRRSTLGDAPAALLSIAEIALVEEAGQAAGRVIARRIAGEPEGVRAFVAGDSPNAILPLDLYSYTSQARANNVPQLRARARTRRAQQVPAIVVLLDTQSLAPGQEGRRLREAYTSICAVVTAIALRSGAATALMALEGGDELVNFRGILDEQALVLAIAAATPSGTRRGVRPLDDLHGCALCVIVSPVSADEAAEILTYCVDLRAQGTRCLLIHPSLRGEDVPGAYWTGEARGRCVVQRQRSGAGGHAADHDALISGLAEGMDVDQLLFVDRRDDVPMIAEAMIESLRGPV